MAETFYVTSFTEYPEFQSSLQKLKTKLRLLSDAFNFY